MAKPIQLTLKTEKEVENDNEEYDYITVPPDGGFAWIVLIACFFIDMITYGFIYSFGVISEELRDFFHCSEWAISLVISIASGTRELIAPITFALCNKWGCRQIGIIGCLITTIAMSLSIFSPNIYIMWIVFGLFAGIGMGLVYLPCIVMIGYYFEEKRAIATGIASAGTGIGSMIFGPISHFLFKHFGWQYGLLMLAAIFLSCIFCCLTMRPLKPIRKVRMHSIPDIDNHLVYEATESSISKTSPVTPEAVADGGLKHLFRDYSKVSIRSQQSITAEDAVRPLYKIDVLYEGDTRDLPEYKSQPDIPTYVQQTTIIPDTRDKSKMKAFWDVFLTMTNGLLLKDKKVLTICLANVCATIGYYTPYLFIIKIAALERSISQTHAVFLLSIIGFSNTAARFASGWIIKIPYLSPLLVCNLGLIVAGIATLLVPFCSTYTLLATYSVIWGTFVAFYVVLSPVVICRIVGLEKYSSALGLSLMFRGMTTLTALPLMGALRDATLSFNISFVVGGISFLASAFLYCLFYRRIKTEF